ncbi:MAG: XrtA/PEP-CTERM system TPR-repeat protein PrsT [Burkholderiaceae bacterium]
MSTPSRLCGILWKVVLAAGLVASCGRESPEELLVSAHTYLSQGDASAAIIQLRNALQQRPEDGAIRVMLGRALLENREPVSAEREFRKALQYGRTQNEVLPLLGRAMLEQGRAESLVSEFVSAALSDPQSESEFKASLGQAQLQTGRVADAAASFAASERANPESLAAQIGRARVLALSGHGEEAVQLAERLAATHSNAPEVHMLVADLRLMGSDHAAAMTALQQSLAADARYLPARYALIAALIDQQQLDAASAELDQARSQAKGDLRIPYFDAVIALSKGDLVKARESVQRVLAHSAEHVPSLILAGAVELKAQQPAAAETLLRRALALAPQQAGARRLLVRTLLDAEQPGKAVESLQPLLAAADAVDTQLALLAGETYLANGDLRHATTYFAAASDASSQGLIARTRIGQIALAAGDIDRGIAQLEAVIAVEGAPAQAALALIAGYMLSNEPDRAVRTAQRLVQKQPTKPFAYQVLGSVHAARNEPADAREQFVKALQMSPGYLPAVSGLSRLDIAANKPADARQRFAVVVAKEPNNEQALLGLADVLSKTSGPAAEITDTLQRAIRANPQSSSAHLALIAHYLKIKDSNLALSAAREASAALPNDTRILLALGRAQELSGQVNQAIDTFKRLALLEPQSTLPLTQLAALHARRGEYARVIEALERAQAISADDPARIRDLVAGFLMSGNPDEAVRQARTLQASAPQSVAGYVLEGDVHSAVRQWGPAERAYRAGLKVEPDAGAIALRVYRALDAGGRNAEADAFAKKWIVQHPKDTQLRARLAERALRAHDFRAAIAHYEAVIERDPENFVVLNNLAWASAQLRDPRAIGYAQRAVRLAPGSAAALDTLGTLLVANGDIDQALDSLRKATELAPKRPDIRLNYAKALIKAGKKDIARTELEALQAAPDDFAGKSEIVAMLRGL